MCQMWTVDLNCSSVGNWNFDGSLEGILVVPASMLTFHGVDGLASSLRVDVSVGWRHCGKYVSKIFEWALE